MAPYKELRGRGQKLQAEAAPSRWRAHACCSPPCWSSSPSTPPRPWSSSWKHGRRPTQLAMKTSGSAKGTRIIEASHAVGSRTAAIQSASRTPLGERSPRLLELE